MYISWCQALTVRLRSALAAPCLVEQVEAQPLKLACYHARKQNCMMKMFEARRAVTVGGTKFFIPVGFSIYGKPVHTYTVLCQLRSSGDQRVCTYGADQNEQGVKCPQVCALRLRFHPNEFTFREESVSRMRVVTCHSCGFVFVCRALLADRLRINKHLEGINCHQNSMSVLFRIDQ